MYHAKSAPPTFSGPKQRIPTPAAHVREELPGEVREMIGHIIGTWPFEQTVVFIAELTKQLFGDLHASIDSAARQEKLSKSRVEQLNNTLHDCQETALPDYPDYEHE